MTVTSMETRVATSLGDKEGLLFFSAGTLVAVFSQLQHESHGELQGKWFLEAGFGPCAHPQALVFDTSEAGRKWVVRQMMLHRAERPKPHLN
jgi:hypothetical protein